MMNQVEVKAGDGGPGLKRPLGGHSPYQQLRNSQTVISPFPTIMIPLFVLVTVQVLCLFYFLYYVQVGQPFLSWHLVEPAELDTIESTVRSIVDRVTRSILSSFSNPA